MSGQRSANPPCRGSLSAIIAAAALAAVLGCASAAAYRPSEWRAAGLRRWATTVDEMDIETRGLVPLPGSRGVAAELTIHNASLSPIGIEGARLETGSGVYGSGPRRPSLDVAPGRTERVPLSFESARPAGEILVDPARLIVVFRTASGRHELAVPLRKEE